MCSKKVWSCLLATFLSLLSIQTTVQCKEPANLGGRQSQNTRMTNQKY